MDSSAIKAMLRDALEANRKAAGRKKTARLREVFEDVEAAMAEGIPREKIVEILGAAGLEMTMGVFTTSMSRIRKERGLSAQQRKRAVSQDQPAKPAARRTPNPESVEEPAGSDSPPAGSHNPADLDKIINSVPDLAGLAKLAKRKRQ